MTVSRNDLITARYSKMHIEPALNALQKVDLQAVQYDKEAHKNITDFTQWLSAYLQKADAVIAQAEVQFLNKPQHIITAALMRVFQIPQALELERKSIELKIDGHRIKTEELRKKQFNDAEIKKILPYPQEELSTHVSNMADLKAEHRKIEEFLHNSPVYDVSLLDMTKLAPFMQHCVSVE